MRQAAVLAATTGGAEAVLVAYVVPAPGVAEGASLTEAIRRHAGERLPAYMVPQAVVALPALPLTPSGKVDRRALPASARPNAPLGSPPPRNQCEAWLLEQWRSLLGGEVGLRENLFEAGGTSLTAAQLVGRSGPTSGRTCPWCGCSSTLPWRRWRRSWSRLLRRPRPERTQSPWLGNGRRRGEPTSLNPGLLVAEGEPPTSRPCLRPGGMRPAHATARCPGAWYALPCGGAATRAPSAGTVAEPDAPTIDEEGAGRALVRAMKTELAIIILNYRTAKLAIDCLASLQGEVDERTAAVVVDNDSRDGSADRIDAAIRQRGFGAWASVRRLEFNGGFAAGNNAGIRSVEADAYVLLNSDTIVRPGVLASLRRAMREHPEAGLIGPSLVGVSGAPEVSAFREIHPLTELVRAACTGPVTRLLRRFEPAMPVPERPAHVDWLGFACVLVRREVIERVGLLDDGYFMYFEDVDYCRAVRAAGFKILLPPRPGGGPPPGRQLGGDRPLEGPAAWTALLLRGAEPLLRQELRCGRPLAGQPRLARRARGLAGPGAGR